MSNIKVSRNKLLARARRRQVRKISKSLAQVLLTRAKASNSRRLARVRPLQVPKGSMNKLLAQVLRKARRRSISKNRLLARVYQLPKVKKNKLLHRRVSRSRHLAQVHLQLP